MDISKDFLKKGLARVALLAIFWNLFLPILNTDAQYNEGSVNTAVNQITTATGSSEFTIPYNTGNILENVINKDNISFTMALDETYSGAVLYYDYCNGDYNNCPTASGELLYTGGTIDFSNSFFSGSVTDGTSTGFTIDFAGLDDGEYYLSVIPGTGSTVEEYFTGAIGDKAIDYSFVVDTEKPILQLIGNELEQIFGFTGSNIIYTSVGTGYIDNGALFTDNVDGTGVVIGSGNIDTNTIGDYILTYDYTDSAGNSAIGITRTVKVYASSELISSTGSSEISSTSTGYMVDFTLSGATIEDGDFIEVSIGEENSIIGDSIVGTTISLIAGQSTGSILVDLGNILENYTGSILNVEVNLYSSGKTIGDGPDSNIFFNVNFVKKYNNEFSLLNLQDNNYFLSGGLIYTVYDCNSDINCLSYSGNLLISNNDFNNIVEGKIGNYIYGPSWLTVDSNTDTGSIDLTSTGNTNYTKRGNILLFIDENGSGYRYRVSDIYPNWQGNQLVIDTFFTDNIYSDFISSYTGATEIKSNDTNYELNFELVGSLAGTGELRVSIIGDNGLFLSGTTLLGSGQTNGTVNIDLLNSLDNYTGTVFFIDIALFKGDLSNPLDYKGFNVTFNKILASSIGECTSTGLAMGGVGCVGDEPISSFSGMTSYNSPELHLDSAITMIDTSDFIDLGNVLTGTGIQFITIGTGAYIDTTCPINSNNGKDLLWLDNAFTGSCNIQFSGTNEVYTISYDNKFIANIADTEKPVIILNGSSEIHILKGTVYSDEGAYFTDNADGTGSITYSGSVDINTVGEYILTYNYTDIAGNIADEVIRKVVVSDIIIPNFISATGSNEINYNDNSYVVDFTLSGTTIKNGDFVTVDIENGSGLIMTGSTILSEGQGTGSININLGNTFETYTGTNLGVHVELYSSGKTYHVDNFDDLREYNISFNKNTYDNNTSINFNGIYNARCNKYDGFIGLPYDYGNNFNLSGSVLPEGVEVGQYGGVQFSNGAYYNIYLNDNIVFTGSDAFNECNGIINPNFGTGVFDGFNNGDNLTFKVGIVDSNGNEYISNTKSLIVDILGQLISATGSSEVSNTSTGYTVDFTLSGATIEDGDFIEVIIGEENSILSIGKSNILMGDHVIWTTTSLIAGQNTGSILVNLGNTFENYTGSILDVEVDLYSSGKTIGDGFDSDIFFNVNFNKNTVPVSINLNSFVKPHCSGECEVIENYGKAGMEMMLNLSGSVYPEGVTGTGNFQNGSYYNIYVNDILTSTGNTFMWRNSDNITDQNTFGGKFLSGAINGDNLTFKVGIVDSNGNEYISNTKSLIVDTQKPQVSVSYVDNNDGTFTLTASGSDNYGDVEYLWFDNIFSSGLGNGGVHDYDTIGTGNTLSISPTVKNYYVTVKDSVGNFNTAEIILPILVSTPNITGFTDVTNSGFTVNWSSTGVLTGFDLLLNGDTDSKVSVSSGTTSYTYTGLKAGESYYFGVIANNGNFSSLLEEQRVQLLGNGINFIVNLDEKCIETDNNWNEYLSINLNDNNYYYDYRGIELTSTSATLAFNNLQDGIYNYNIWAGKCGNVKGNLILDGRAINKNITVSAGKWIKTIVRENTSTGNIVSQYSLELNLTDSSNTNYWNYNKYAYVENSTGTLLKLEDVDYNVNVRDIQSWSKKTIVGVYKNGTGTSILSNNNISSSSYSSGDTLTIVVKEGNVINGTTNISTDGYISLYASGTNDWIAGTSIRNGKFTMIGIPDGDYTIKASSYDYKYNSYEENITISSDLTDKGITFTTKNLDLAGSFNKAFALEGGLVRLKLDPKQNSTGALSFASGADIIESASYKIYNNSGIVISNGDITDLTNGTGLTNLENNSVTVDINLKSTISTDINFLTVNFKDLELSLPISRINFDSPTTVKTDTDFSIKGNAPKNSIVEVIYNGQTIGSGSSINGGFDILAKISSEGSGSLLVKDITNNIVSESKQITVGSNLPILSGYNIKVNNLDRITNTENKIKYFSVWAGHDLKVKDNVEVSTTFTENQPDSIKYYIGGVELINGKLDKYKLEGYGTKDVIVEYTKAGNTYSQVIAKMVILIDPAGYVYNNSTNKKIAGLTATLYELQDKDGNRVTATGGVDLGKLSSYKGDINTATGYNKTDIISTINACQGGGNSYPCTWVKYDSTGYGEEPNPQVTDDEGHYAWMTPEGYYYVAFNDTDGYLNNGNYGDFDSLVAHIPPEVTDLNVGVDASCSTGNHFDGSNSTCVSNTQTESSTNYTRTRTWNTTDWSNWTYSCLNNYTGDTCQNAPVVRNSGGGGGGGGGGSYHRRSTNNITKQTGVDKKTVIKKAKDPIKKNITKVISTKVFKTKKFKTLSKKLDNKIVKIYKKFELYDFDKNVLDSGNKFIKSYNGLLDSLALIEKAGKDKEKLKEARVELIKNIKDFKKALKDRQNAINKIGKIKVKTFGKNKIEVLEVNTKSKLVKKVEKIVDKVLDKKLKKDFSNAENIIKLRNKFIILINNLVEAKDNKDINLFKTVRKDAINTYIDLKKNMK